MKLSMADEEIQVNPALELYLRERHRVGLPELPETPGPEALGAFLEQVRARVADHGWKAEAEVWLSTYSFESLALYRDLKALGDIAVRNRIVGALARATAPEEASESLGEEALDQAPTPTVAPLPVLPTDSSQLRALTIVRTGRDLVIHGPPGTGKSQTIANLIADALGQGKTVLFVSAKMAALEVVYRRLAQLGLDRFCLEAHSAKAGKARVIDELRRTLAAAERAPDADRWEGRIQEFVHVRERLNRDVRALHERRPPLHLSPHEAIGKAEKLRTVPEISGRLPWDHLLAVTPGELRDALDALVDLGAQAEVFDNRATHPWRGLVIEPGRAVPRDQIESDLRRVSAAAQVLVEHLPRLEPLLGPVAGLGCDGVRRLARPLAELGKITRLPSGWAERAPAELQATAAVLEEAAAKAEEEVSKKAEHETTWTLAPSGTIRLLEPVETQFSNRLRGARPAYWRWRREVRRRMRPQARADFQALRRALATARRLEALRAWFEQRSGALAAEVGPGCVDFQEDGTPPVQKHGAPGARPSRDRFTARPAPVWLRCTAGTPERAS